MSELNMKFREMVDEDTGGTRLVAQVPFRGRYLEVAVPGRGCRTVMLRRELKGIVAGDVSIEWWNVEPVEEVGPAPTNGAVERDPRDVVVELRAQVERLTRERDEARAELWRRRER